MKIDFKLKINSSEIGRFLLPILESKFENINFSLTKKSTPEYYIRAINNEDKPISNKVEIENCISNILNDLGPLGQRVKNYIYFSHKSKRQQSHNSLLIENILGNENSGSALIMNQLEDCIQELDRLFEQFFKSMGANSVSIPVVLTESYLTTCSVLPEMKNQIHFINEQKGCCPSLALSPALCLGSYKNLIQNSKGTEQILTAVGKVFRKENSRYGDCHSLERLREYRCREIIFLTEEEKYIDYKEKLISFMTSFLLHFDLSSQITPASDMFFDSKMGNKVIGQLLEHSKIEVKILDDDSEELAVASLNYHSKKFITSFGSEDQKLNSNITFCFGVGLERLGYALFRNYNNYTQLMDKLSSFKNLMEINDDIL